MEYKSKKTACKNLANAVITQAVKDKDLRFLESQWGEIIMFLANVGNRKDDIIKIVKNKILQEKELLKKQNELLKIKKQKVRWYEKNE